MRVVQSVHFCQLGSISSLATETTDGKILVVAFFGPNMASEAISECLIFKIFLGSRPPDPSSLFTLNHAMPVPALKLGLITFTSFHVPLSHDPPRRWGQGTSALMCNQG